jgi:acyl-CoA thioester hydrolase
MFFMDYIFERKINYYETDKMGVVHHSNYARFLEEARGAMLDDLDIPYGGMEDMGIMIPVLFLSSEYKRHVTYDDTIVIKLRITEFTGVRMSVQYEITNKATGDLVMNAETKHCFTNTSLKPISLKKHYPKAYEILLKNTSCN